MKRLSRLAIAAVMVAGLGLAGFRPASADSHPPCTVQAFQHAMANFPAYPVPVGHPVCDFVTGWARQEFTTTSAGAIGAQPFFFRITTPGMAGFSADGWTEQFDVSDSTYAHACQALPPEAQYNLVLDHCGRPKPTPKPTPKPRFTGSGSIKNCNSQQAYLIFGKEFELCLTVDYKWDSSSGMLTESETPSCWVNPRTTWFCNPLDWWKAPDFGHAAGYRLNPSSQNPSSLPVYDFYFYWPIINVSTFGPWWFQTLTCVRTNTYIQFDPQTRTVVQTWTANWSSYTMVPLADSCDPSNDPYVSP